MGKILAATNTKLELEIIESFISAGLQLRPQDQPSQHLLQRHQDGHVRGHGEKAFRFSLLHQLPPLPCVS